MTGTRARLLRGIGTDEWEVADCSRGEGKGAPNDDKFIYAKGESEHSSSIKCWKNMLHHRDLAGDHQAANRPPPCCESILNMGVQLPIQNPVPE